MDLTVLSSRDYFKENCPDVRNTKAVDLSNSIKRLWNNITIHDPWAR